MTAIKRPCPDGAPGTAQV